MTRYRFYTATSLDGFLADEHDSLDWLLSQPTGEEGILPYDRFIVEQLAADKLELGSDRRPLTAMGFLTVGNAFLNNQHDVIDEKEKSLETTPFIVARETHGERVVPAWMDAIPGRMRILIHSLPVRQQIEIPVQEQLIVEYYSKK